MAQNDERLRRIMRPLWHDDSDYDSTENYQCVSILEWSGEKAGQNDDEAPMSTIDTEPTMDQTSAPRYTGLTIDIPPDECDDDWGDPEDSVDLSDEESKGMTSTQI